MTEKKKARLENWMLGIDRIVWPPEIVLIGEAYDHPGFKAGNPVVTSPIVSVDFVKCIAETVNTIYALGERSLKYKEKLDSHNEFVEIMCRNYSVGNYDECKDDDASREDIPISKQD